MDQITSICSGCESLQLHKVLEDGHTGFIDTAYHPGLDSYAALKESSKTCPSCSYIYEALEVQIQLHTRRRLLESHWREQLASQHLRVLVKREKARVGVCFALDDVPFGRDSIHVTLSLLVGMLLAKPFPSMLRD
jgi:hypothetical protein